MSVEKFPVPRTMMFAMTLVASTAFSRIVSADTVQANDTVQLERAADGFPWSVIMLLAALLLTAYISRGQCRGEN